jgi:hypothetical protein
MSRCWTGCSPRFVSENRIQFGVLRRKAKSGRDGPWEDEAPRRAARRDQSRGFGRCASKTGMEPWMVLLTDQPHRDSSRKVHAPQPATIAWARRGRAGATSSQGPSLPDFAFRTALVLVLYGIQSPCRRLRFALKIAFPGKTLGINGIYNVHRQESYCASVGRKGVC